MYSKIIIKAFLLLLILTSLSITAYAMREADGAVVEWTDTAAITDDNIRTHAGGENVKMSIVSDESMTGIYIKFNSPPSPGTLDSSTTISENGFLHEFIPLRSSTAVLEWESADICDIYIFEGNGIFPEWIQSWSVGSDQTDLLLLATHSDDDQLFFAGLLPLYTSKGGINVQVAYFINHYDTYNRTHELLDGLWHCGVTTYPEISPFPDGYSESIDEASGYLLSQGFDKTAIEDYHKMLLEKYKPLVVVLHDFDGEYGHGAHKLATKSFVEAVESGVSEHTPEKIYVHLYPENKITLDIDTPLNNLGGKTPFQVSQEAFGFHKSQHWTWFYSWIYGKNSDITMSSQIRSYNPANYGLYFSSVGNDTSNDILENVTTYSDRRAADKTQESPIIADEPVIEDPTLEIKEEPVADEPVEQKSNKDIPVFVYIPAVLIVLAIILSPKRKKK